MLQLIEQMFSGVNTVIESMAEAIKTAFLNFIYVDPAATTPVLSDVAQFSFIIAGVGIGMGVLYMIIRLIKR